MEIQESLPEKVAKIFGTIEKGAKNMKEAMQEYRNESYDLKSINSKEKLLDFSRIEDDVKKIYKDIQKKGDTVLGSHLILDGKNDLMEINIYTQKNGETFQTTIKAEVQRVTNIPSHVRDELKNSGRVELNLKL
ncbi:hypothetical protein [Microcystis aeruginosa]|jgi:hypothetical protein|uniref:Uncharacterized protein n=1 Tax=Microcystis aeruginosa NIES-2521 TaxID=2303983 RepID=A0A5A5RVX8_MICAE|nr:hypothetical protein [Microcystis aeruginosa]GCA80320.1 hypothetical protein MiTs_02327 [Microcystis aeruginosa NIES-2521]